MYFYKKSNGKWQIGVFEIPAGKCLTATSKVTGAISIELIGSYQVCNNVLPTEFKDVNGNYYADLAAYEAATSGFFVDAALAAAEQLAVDLGVEVQNRTSEDANLQNQIDAVASGYLGAIAYNASAPTPAKNGWYDFSTGGVVSWLTGTPAVKTGDRVSVLYTSPSTYVYTYQNINLNGVLASKTDVDNINNVLIGGIPSLNIQFQQGAITNFNSVANGNTQIIVSNLVEIKSSIIFSAQTGGLIYVFYSNDGINIIDTSAWNQSQTINTSYKYFRAQIKLSNAGNIGIQYADTLSISVSKINGVVNDLKELAQGVNKAILGSDGVYGKMTKKSVKKDGSGDFTTIQDAINSITDARIDNQYVINVYDDFIITDMTQLWLQATPTSHNANANPTASCALVITKDYISIIGYGRRKKLYVYAPYALTGSSFQYIQTIFAQGNFVLDNFDIQVKNGRYAIHQESGGTKTSLDYNAISRYKNLNIEHLGNIDSSDGGTSWTSVFAQANGGCSGLKMIYENCHWKSPRGPFYTHDNVNFDNQMSIEFTECSMFLNNGGLDSLSGTTTQYDNLVNMSSMGSGIKETVKIVGCNFFSFGVGNTAWSGQTLSDLTHDWRNGGSYLFGHGNKPMKIPAIYVDTLTFKSSILNGTIDVLDDRGTNVNSAYGLVFGDTLKKLNGAVDSYALIVGCERLVDDSAGSKTFSLAYRLGNCSVTNKTLTVIVNGVAHIITFNSDYTQLSGGNLVYPLGTILTAINSQLASYCVASTHTFVEWICFSDTYEFGFNASDTKSILRWGKALVRDYTRGFGGWRLAQAGEKIEGISTGQMNAFSVGSLSYEKVLLRGKCNFSTINPAIIFNMNAMGVMYKAGEDGVLVTTTNKLEADFIGVGNSTLIWNI